MKHEKLSWNAFTFSNALLMFLINEEQEREKRSFDSENLTMAKNPWIKKTMAENQERQKCMFLHILKTFVQWQIPALSSNECYTILLIIYWFLYIDYSYMLCYLPLTLIIIQHVLITSSYIDFNNSLQFTFFILQ